ncbi:MAG: chromosomal replication initiator protein DnaA [Bradyrhizobiaceae bacterium]|nr:chromosomal replication initiator protein DnaA [Bradyrhizobiaceae bacterium]
MAAPKQDPKREPPDNDAIRWDRVCRRLRAEVGEDVYSSWFTSIAFEGRVGDCLRLSVPTRFLRNWIQSHYGERLLTLARDEFEEMRRIDLAVRTTLLRVSGGEQKPARPDTAAPALERPAGAPPRMPVVVSAGDSVRQGSGGSPLDPRFTFETFLVGRSNALAHAAARQVGEAEPGTGARFNPLYTHAAVGLGKTHLLQAIVWAGQASGRRMMYLTAEKFMYGFVAALKSQSAIAFKEALRGIEVLVIDDLQFMQGPKVQLEFCHTLNALIDAGRQVVIAADRTPVELESLEERVRSRLAAGLVVEVAPPEVELRQRILETRVATLQAQHPGFEVPDAVLQYVSQQVTQNGRDLDGAVNRLLAHNQLSGRPVTVEMADEVIRDLIRPADPRRIRVEDILRIVAKHYGVSRADLLSSRRTANVVRPRQIAMYLAKTLTLRSLPEIGRRFGGRDHTTVLHAVRKIEGLVQGDKGLADEIDALKRLLQE